MESDVSSAEDWNDSRRPRLWNYNLHYFDDLNATNAPARREWHANLIARWIIENPATQGVGWESYPLSIRIVNWIKWGLAGNQLEAPVLRSLATQVRYLARRIEWHLLGNHLFSNAKALVMAGCFFDGAEADLWLEKGMSILLQEIPEQILPDGGHFERSTMYHALAFEDLMDLMNMSMAYPETFGLWARHIAGWQDKLVSMATWLRTMCHPDGEIAFFNDAAIGIAPCPAALFGYAERLGIDRTPSQQDLVKLEDSGYIRVSLGDAVLIADLAPLGPEYLPAHGHADTLCYELSINGRRVIVNSGTSLYAVGPERDWERSTGAHNTVEIDGENSSETWGGFRVARRARPLLINVSRDANSISIEGAHDGYCRLSGSPIHHRRWKMSAGRLEVFDEVRGGFSRAVSRVYFSPDCDVQQAGNEGVAILGSTEVVWIASGEFGIGPSSWRPEFGKWKPNKVLEIKLERSHPSCTFSLNWKS